MKSEWKCYILKTNTNSQWSTDGRIMQSVDWYLINTEGHNDIIIKTNHNLCHREKIEKYNEIKLIIYTPISPDNVATKFLNCTVNENRTASKMESKIGFLESTNVQRWIYKNYKTYIW